LQPQTISAMVAALKNFLSLIKFSHTVFALPFALIGFFMGIQAKSGAMSWQLFIAVLACMVFARSAAMAFNRLVDRRFDLANPRTNKREIPAGIITPNSALLFVVINCCLFIVTTFFINTICFYLSPVALLVVLGYSFTKRFTALCHLVLGIGLSLAPIGAYLAITGQFAFAPLLVSFTVLTWVSGFDIIYALQDEEFDRSNQLHSIPAFMGVKRALHLSTLLHIISAFLIILLGYFHSFHLYYWIGAILFASLLIYQHSLVKPTDLSKVNLAFATTNGIGSVLFASFVIADILFTH